ncbi:class A beta-lactamase-related serine hydrolase [Nonomuraea deserti]|uniref:Class A beta-lactamase-related serine hydrolase n=1 Tax=Nonomuraea deserti TaxID=1848322 RepID=A0A4R4VZK9_9ACTN|nr:serine hydrolase domain-containing protein [Nonomuraea deserti]TDD11572.1 class A beta-lactamase-related serine hydrolase [Nonomuraea deserti]
MTTSHRPIDLVKLSSAKPCPVEIGTFNYSNTNYLLLGMIIERVTGKTLAAELDRRLLTPLGMKSTYLPTTPTEEIKGLPACRVSTEGTPPGSAALSRP